MISVSSWGRLSASPHEVISLDEPALAADLVSTHRPGIAHGMGRSYGDVCLNPNGVLWKTTGLDRFIHFDEVSGKLICEAGILLSEIQRLTVPRGWMLPVSPGTQFITVGGAIANDVHGKNHHRLGTFGNHVQRILLLRTDGQVIECGPDHQADWFAATVGGMGLTGLMLEVEIQLRKVDGPWLQTETLPYGKTDEFFSLADQSEAGWEHTVSWLDCSANSGGRGIFLRANPSPAKSGPAPKQRKLSMPPLPFSLINSLSLRPLCTAYYQLKKLRAGAALEHFESFSYPLDHILQVNKIYGPNGFFQYQSVVPPAVGRDATHAMLNQIAKSGECSFLTVLKTFGNQTSVGMMSFARPGVTLALDFPNRGASTSNLFERLDAIVREAGGALYSAKDARMPRELFELGYPRLNEFLSYRDPGISSGMSRRLMGV